jgi:26S proteasome regulatory subunit N2
MIGSHVLALTVFPLGVLAGLLSLLDEPESSLQSYALEQINSLIDTFWAEVADHVVKM